MEARSLSNQQAMEQALGKLVMDGEFRDAFFRDPAVANEAAGSPLTDGERNALTRISPGTLAAFQRYLDAKRLGADSNLYEEHRLLRHDGDAPTNPGLPIAGSASRQAAALIQSRSAGPAAHECAAGHRRGGSE